MEKLRLATVTVLGDETTMGELGLAAILYVIGSKTFATIMLILAIISACRTLFGKK